MTAASAMTIGTATAASSLGAGLCIGITDLIDMQNDRIGHDGRDFFAAPRAKGCEPGGNISGHEHSDPRASITAEPGQHSAGGIGMQLAALYQRRHQAVGAVLLTAHRDSQ